MAKTTDSVAEFFASYPPAVSELANAVRKIVRAALPGAAETLDEPGRVVGYGVGAGYSGLVCTIIAKSGVKLGIVRGADFPDPHALLEGVGKRHRYVQFNRPEDVDRAGIDTLLEAARSAAKSTR